MFDNLNYEFEGDKIVEDTINNVNKIVDSKRLQLNYIWSTKITQEDLCTAKSLDDPQQNILLTNVIFQSILKLADKINENFKNLLYSENYEINEEKITILVVMIGAMMLKCKNFYQVKNKHFKIEKIVADPLVTLEKYFGLFKINLGENIVSKKVEEFHVFINEFNSMLEEEGHIK